MFSNETRLVVKQIFKFNDCFLFNFDQRYRKASLHHRRWHMSTWARPHPEPGNWNPGSRLDRFQGEDGTEKKVLNDWELGEDFFLIHLDETCADLAP